MPFLFRKFPCQELSHLLWFCFQFRFVLSRNHHICCDFFSVIFLFRNFHTWCDFFSDFLLFRNHHTLCDSCSEIVLFRNLHISGEIFSDLFRFRKNRIWHDFLFLSRNSVNRSCVPFWSSVAMQHVLAHHIHMYIYIVSRRSPDKILYAALGRFFLEAVPKLLQGTFFFLGWISFWWLNFEKTRTISISNMAETMLLISYMYVIYIYLFTQFFLFSYLNNISICLIVLRL